MATGSVILPGRCMEEPGRKLGAPGSHLNLAASSLCDLPPLLSLECIPTGLPVRPHQHTHTEAFPSGPVGVAISLVAPPRPGRLG